MKDGAWDRRAELGSLALHATKLSLMTKSAAELSLANPAAVREAAPSSHPAHGHIRYFDPGWRRDHPPVLIAHVIARLNDGGPARVLLALARMMAAQGIRSVVLAGATEAHEPDLSGLLAAEGVVVERVRGLGRRLHPSDDLRAWRALVARLRALRPDVVHTHTAKAGALGRLAARELGLPCVHTYHGHVLGGYFARLPSLAAAACERLAAGTAHHHALTASQHAELAGLHRIGRAARWHVLPIPVAAVTPVVADWHQRLRPGVVRIGFLGRMVPIKDGRLWLETLAVLAGGRQVQGVMCGDGPERAMLERNARSLGLDVHFTGFVSAGEALAAFDLLLMTSRNEGLPLAAVEAAAAGVPVVAPAVGGLADLARAGLVRAAPRQAAALAAACARLLTDAQARQAQITAARVVAAGLRPDQLAPRYAALYRTVSRSNAP